MGSPGSRQRARPPAAPFLPRDPRAVAHRAQRVLIRIRFASRSASPRRLGRSGGPCNPAEPYFSAFLVCLPV
eukprot:scaffold120992_cov63-Phaeocystis_antarctica.AAC.1